MFLPGKLYKLQWNKSMLSKVYCTTQTFHSVLTFRSCFWIKSTVYNVHNIIWFMRNYPFFSLLEPSVSICGFFAHLLMIIFKRTGGIVFRCWPFGVRKGWRISFPSAGGFWVGRLVDLLPIGWWVFCWLADFEFGMLMSVFSIGRGEFWYWLVNIFSVGNCFFCFLYLHFCGV